jgi:hypothetical protein
MGSYGSGQGPTVGSCGHCNEASSSIKGWEFLEYPSDY